MRRLELRNQPAPPLFVVTIPRQILELPGLEQEFSAAEGETPDEALRKASLPPEKESLKLRNVLAFLRTAYLAGLPNHHIQILLALLEVHPRTLPTGKIAEITSIKRRTLEESLNTVPRYIHSTRPQGVKTFGLTDEGVQLSIRLLRHLLKP